MAAPRKQWKKYDRTPPKLQHYGKIFSERFFDKESSLHECQKEALQSLVRWFSKEDTEDLTAVVVMPAGTGKKGVICCLPYVIGGAIPLEKINIRKPILVIAPGLVILEQLKENLLPSDDCFLYKRELLDKEDMEHYYTVFTVTKTSQLSNTGAAFRCSDIVLSNAQKWRRDKHGTPNYKDLPADLFSMVMVTDAHHLPADQWENIIDKFRGYAKVVFLTATTERGDGREITADLAISKKPAYELTRKEATKKKLIRDVKPEYLNTPPTQSDKDNVTQAIKTCSLEKPDKISNERLAYAQLVLKKVKERMGEKNKSRPLPGNAKHSSIIIANNIAEADVVESMCISLGFSEEAVAVLHTKAIKAKKGVREEIIKNIREYKYKIVIVVMMLLESFEHPSFSIGGIVTGIRSPVKFTQFVGRVQRLVRQPTVGENVVEGDIITHDYFEQKTLFEKHICPRIPKEENKSLDEDYEVKEE